MGTCTYCGSDVAVHDPVSVTEGTDPTAGPTKQFCNYACLAAHIETAGLVAGTACEWTPE